MNNKKQKSKAKRILKIALKTLLILAIASQGAVAYLYLTYQKETEAVDDCIAQTTYGTLRGYIDDDVYTYHGIEYAKATERFVPAVEPDAWSGVKDAIDYGQISPQGAIFGLEPDNTEVGDNNCQNLNLWTKGLSDGAKRPVMVYLHGGGLSVGSGNEEYYDGANLARDKDVVVITINHRLNIYGHLDLRDYGEKYRYSANVGISDIVAALKWVRSNAASFGGDPDNITVFGQSGGGVKILALMTSFYAQGLYDKAIIQSGASDVQGAVFTSGDVSKYLTQCVLDELNISDNNIEDIQTVDNKSLQDASTKALDKTANRYKIPVEVGEIYALEWQPVVDYEYIASNPVVGDSFAEAGRDIPVLIGSNLEEWAVMGNQRHNVNNAIRKEFKKAYPNESVSIAGNTDVLLRQPILKIIRHKALQGGADVYAYVYTYQERLKEAGHNSEIPYVFRNTNENDEFMNIISSMWVSFAKDGVPSYKGIDKWEPYNLNSGATMILDEKSYLAYNHDVKLLDMINPGYKY